MESRVENALKLHKEGLNCAQSIVCNYCDLFGLREDTAFKMAEGFGAGMGNMKSVCGALTGLYMILGLKCSSGTKSEITKAKTAKVILAATEKFKNKNGSIICSELKGITSHKMLRSCDGCIEDACRIFEEFVNSLEQEKLQDKVN